MYIEVMKEMIYEKSSYNAEETLKESLEKCLEKTILKYIFI